MKFFPNSLQLDLLKRHVGPFLFCFFTVMFLLLMQFLILQIDRLVGKDIPFLVIVELIVTNLSYMVVLAGPMAVLVATLLAFGKFSELHELTALRASGVSPFTMIKPILIASIILGIGLAYFSNEILPEANHKARSIFFDIRLKKPGFDLKENQFYNGIENYTFLVKRIDSSTDSLYDVTLYQEAKNNRNRAVITAETGFLRSEGQNALTLMLYNGEATQFHPGVRGKKELIERSQFSTYRLTFDLSDLSFERSDPNNRSRSDRTMNAQSMMVVVDSLRREIATIKNIDTLRSFSLKKLSKPLADVKNAPPNSPSYLAIEQQRDTLYTPADDFAYVVSPYFFSRSSSDRSFNYALDELRSYKAQLEDAVADVLWREKRVSKFLVEIHKKVSIPFACLVFALIGAPIGIMTRKGNLGYAALISAVVLTFYWTSLIQGEKLADRLYITPFWGMWFTNILLGTIGIYLIIHLNTEFKINRLWSRKSE